MRFFDVATKLRREERGAALVEFTLVLLLFIVVTFGLIEFGLLYFQWNSAQKATQVGARLAAVSYPVAENLELFDGTGGGAVPGSDMPPFAADGSGNALPVVCSGASASCSNWAAGYDSAAMEWIVFGADGACQANPATRPLGMCDFWDEIQVSNVTVTYLHSNLGFVGQPGGPTPTIVVELSGLTFDFFATGQLFGYGPITLPPFTVTVTGEDLSSAGVS